MFENNESVILWLNVRLNDSPSALIELIRVRGQGVLSGVLPLFAVVSSCEQLCHSLAFFGILWKHVLRKALKLRSTLAMNPLNAGSDDCADLHSNQLSADLMKTIG